METHFENGPVYPIPVAPDSWASLLARLARSLWSPKLPLRGSSAFAQYLREQDGHKHAWFLKTTREVGCRSSRCAARALPRASTLCSSSLVAHL